jgi:ParB family chromosome partitioning protein
LLQPISVRRREDGHFELIAGERRLRAAARLGWATIPALVKPLDNRDMLVLALVENLQRADLNPLDEAMGYQRLIAEFGHTQQQVADAVGKDRSTIANLLRVLGLPEGIRRLIRDGQLSLGHARALLAMPNERAMIEVARKAVEQQLSVREVERLAQAQREQPAASSAPPRATPEGRSARRGESAEVRRLTELLRRRLQTDVQIQLQADSRGSVVIAFYSPDDLHRVMELVLGERLDNV